jgi:uncharacterized membrane protein YbhN (UPF0104 family)
MMEAVVDKKVGLRENLFKVRTLLGFVVALVVIYIFLRRFDINSAFRSISNANWLFIFLSIIIFYISLPLRAARWHILLKPTGQKVSRLSLSHYYFLSWFANSILPARIGDVYRAYLLKKNKGIPVSLSLGVLFSERVFDLAITAALVVLSGTYFWSLLQNSDEKSYLKWGLLATAGIVIGFIILIFSMPLVIRILPKRLKSLAESFQAGIFKWPSLFPIIILTTVIIWLTEALRLYFVFLALGIKSGFLMAVFISQASLILMAIPLTPAGLGLVEGLMLVILSSLGISKDLALAATIADRLISYWLLVAAGTIVYLLSSRTR